MEVNLVMPLVEHNLLEDIGQHRPHVITMMGSVLTEGLTELNHVGDVQVPGLTRHPRLPVLETEGAPAVAPPVRDDSRHRVPSCEVLLTSDRVFVFWSFLLLDYTAW